MVCPACIALVTPLSPLVPLADGELALSPFWQSLHVFSDFLIGICYLSISAALLTLVARTGRALPYRWLFLAFGTFIVSCGWTHFMHVAVVANTANWGWLGVSQAVTVVTSGATTLLLPRSVPAIMRFITEARRVQEHAATVQKQAELFALVYDAIIVRDLDNHITFWNDGATQIYGWNRDQALGQFVPSLLQATFPDDLSWEAIEQILLTTGRWEGEVRHQTHDGRRIVVATRKVLQRADDGTPQAILESNRDITAQRQAEMYLRESEERVRAVLAVLAEGVVLQDADGAIITANASAERILGLRETQLLGRTSVDPRWEAIHENGEPFPGETHPAKVALTTGTPQTNVVMGTRVANGTIRWLSVNAHPLFHPDESRPYGVVASFHDITERKELEERLRHEALYDPLTGLANRTLFVDRLQLAIARYQRTPERDFAVLFLDLDRFKQVNDAWGHLAGDELLVAAAQRFQESVRAGDTVGRFGGDEFAILLENPGSVHGVERLAERIRQSLVAPVRVAHQEIVLSISIGTATSSTRYSLPEEMLRDADTALYRAKAAGRGRVVAFDDASAWQGQGTVRF